METILISLITSVSTAAILTIIFSIIFKGSPKVDKGFKIFYPKLSYRRKMIRTLTTLPIAIVAIIVVYYYTNLGKMENVLVGLLFFVIFAGQLFYNLYMWKTKEK